MIVLLSPSKTLNFSKTTCKMYSTPRLLDETNKLIKKLSTLSKPALIKLMSISKKLATLNYDRFRAFSEEHSLHVNAKQSILSFNGGVYDGIDVAQFNTNDLTYAQKHVRILSGLYGLLRPLDLIQPYRLEMGTNLKIYRKKNLYEFWGDKLTTMLISDMKDIGSNTIINLASNEYIDAIQKDKIQNPIISIDFREWRDGDLKFISYNAKKARGTMTKYIVKEQISTIDKLKQFNLDGYVFDKKNSDETKLLFTKKG